MTRPLTLCYHGVSERWESTLATSPDRLRAQLSHLLAKGYEGVTFSALVGGEAPAKAVAVTFDDGFRSVFEHALPVLEELGIPGTVFVPVGLMGQSEPMSWPGIEIWRGTDFEDELISMTWDQVRALRSSGWEIGSHTVSHPRLTELSDEELFGELSDSREWCSRELEEPCRTLAYPYGANDRRVRAAVKEAGYLASAGMSPGPPDALCWPRTGVYPLDGKWRFRVKTSPAVRAFRDAGVGRALERGRGLGHRHRA
jgi:peptidoglycan/xylan/chitin deacetylase (PgdA/CDA1 family)